VFATLSRHTAAGTCINCYNNALSPSGSRAWTSCACTAGLAFTTSVPKNLARACGVSIIGPCPVTASSTLTGVLATNLVDRNMITYFHSNSQGNAHVMIDFQQTVFVSTVRIYNRAECCFNRLNNFDIRVGDSSTFINNPACTSGQASRPRRRALPAQRRCTLILRSGDVH
jgi:hypothetical protein